MAMEEALVAASLVIEVVLPDAFFEGNPEVIEYEWIK